MATQKPPVPSSADPAPAAPAMDAGRDVVAELLAKAERSRGGPAVEALERASEALASRGDAEQALLRIEEALRRTAEGTVEPRLVARVSVTAALAHESTLGRLDRAVELLEKALALDPGQPRAIEAGRRIYAAVGNLSQVARLCEVELEVALTRVRKLELLVELASLRMRMGEPGRAAEHLEQAVQLDPQPALRERLADLYAGAEFAEQADDLSRAQGLQRAAALFRELARECRRAGDHDAEVLAYRRALGAAPDDIEAARGLETAYRSSLRLPELKRLYQQAPWLPGASRHVAELAVVAISEKSGTRSARVSLAVDTLLAAAMAGDEIADLLQQLEAQLAGPEDHRRAAQLYEQILPLGDERDPLDLADRLVVIGKHHKAAADLSRFETALLDALEAYPGHEEAYALMTEHLTARRDYATLVSLAEAALATAPPDEHPRRLEDLADLYDKRLGDVAGATDAWTRRLAFGRFDRAETELRRLKIKQDRWAGLVHSLERELEAASGADARAEVLRRLGQIHRERHDLPRARALFTEALDLRPGDPSLYRTLAELCELEGRYEELAALLRRQYAEARERVERLNLLRRLAALHEERLGDWEGVRWACEEILEQLPSDRDALVRLELGHEAEGEIDDWIRVVEQHAAAAATPAEKVELIRRLALRYEERNELALAADRWERLLKLDRSDLEAMRALARTLEGLDRPAEAALAYARLLEAPRGTGRPADALPEAARADAWRAYARIVEALEDRTRARAAWEQLLALRPADREALDALTLLHRERNDARALEQIVERRLSLSQGSRAVELGLELARLLAARNAIPEARARVESLLIVLDGDALSMSPGKDALELATALAERAGDPHATVLALERRYHAIVGERPQLARRIAEHWSRISPGGPASLLSWERVRSLAPDDPDTLLELSTRYAAAGGFAAQREVDMHRLVLAEQAGDRAKAVTIGEGLAELVEGPLGDPRGAFAELERVLGSPAAALHARVLDNLRALAARAGLWSELARVLEQESALDARIERAQLFEERLREPRRAYEILCEAARPPLPSVTPLLPHLLRLAERTGDVQQLLDTLRDALPSVSEAEKIAILKARSDVRERRAKDPSGALDELLRAVPLLNDATTLDDEIRRLALAAHRYEDLLALVSLRATQATRGSALRGALLDEAAQLAERQLAAPRRAFRIRLSSLGQVGDPLAPPADLESELWRLGTLAASSPPDAAPGERTQLPSLLAAPVVVPPRPRGDQTLEVEIGDLIVEGRKPRNDATMELQIGDLAQVARGAPPPVPPRVAAPPPLPGVRAQPEAPAIDAVWLAGAPALDRRLLPPAGADTPWDELASVMLRADRTSTRPTTRAHLAVARMWEEGARNLDRAFDEMRTAFVEAVRTQSSTDELRTALDALSQRHQAEDRTVDILDAAISATASSDRAVALYVDSAAVRDRQGRLDDAEARYKRVLGIRPGLPEATTWLEAHYRRTERLDALAELLEQRLDDVFDRDSSTRRATQAIELADLYEQSGKRYEAIATLEALVHREPDHAGALARLERIYEAAGQWGKVIDSLHRRIDVVEAGDGSAKHPESRRLRLRVASLYEHELDRPERALEAYRALDRGFYDPQVDEAAERLMQQLGRWDELAALYARRQSMVPPAQQEPLLRKRVTLTRERSLAGESLADLLRALSLLVPEDEDVLAELEQQLEDAPLAERIQVASRRLQRAEARGAGPAERARLLAALGEREAEAGQSAEATHTLEQALALAPDDRAISDDLDSVRRGNWTARSGAKAPEDPTAQASAEIASARAELDRGDRGRALALAEAVILPDAAQPLAELRALFADLGERARVTTLLRRELGLAPESGLPRAQLLSLLALELRATGELDAAAAAYHHAHDAEPGYAPAVHGLADLAAMTNTWDDVEPVLRYAATAQGVRPMDAAALHRRIAEAATARGNLDEAYAALLEADRRVPGDLRTRLQLGRNRYAQGRFREAAQQLGVVAEHPDLCRLGAPAAQALYEGALAEVKIKRPERVPLLLRAALALDPVHDAALGMLAAQRLEHGDRAAAVALLERQAQASPDPTARAARWERVSRMLRDDLDDPVRARSALNASVAASDESGGRPAVAVMDALLDLERRLGDLPEAAITAARLLSYSASPIERARRLRDAAALEAATGDDRAAREHLASAHELDQADQETLAGYSALLVKLGDDEAAAVLLTRVLPQLPAPSSADRRVRAAMWQRLGEVRDRLRDVRGASLAYERVLEYDPGRAPLRTMLLDRYGEDPSYEQQVAAHRAVHLDRDPLDLPSLDAQERLERRAGRTLRADVLASLRTVASALREGRPIPASTSDLAAPPPLGDAELLLLEHPEAMVLSEVFAALYEGLPPDQLADLASLGVDPTARIPAMSDAPVATTFAEVARFVGNRRASLYLKPGLTAPILVVRAPTAVVISDEIAAQPRPELRFLFGRALWMVRPEHALVVGLTRSRLNAMLMSVVHAFHPLHIATRTTSDAEGQQLRKELPYKVVRRLTELFQREVDTAFSSARWRRGVEHSAHRAALAACRDFAAAARVLKAEGDEAAIVELARFALSDAYLGLLERIV